MKFMKRYFYSTTPSKNYGIATEAVNFSSKLTNNK